VDSFYVYRETGTNIYQQIGAVHFDSLSRFIDTLRTKYFPNTGDPNVGTYRYKLRTKDTCGNYSQYSPYHNTIFIVNNNGTFTWPQPYQIEGAANPVSSYVLERDNNSTGSWQAIGSVSGTQSFVIDPLYSTYQNTASWRVKTVWPISCIPSKGMSYVPSYSNKVTNNMIGVKEENLADFATIYPNPSNGIFMVKIQNGKQIGKNITIEIYNTLGEKIFSRQADNTDSISIQSHAPGVYFVIIKVGNTTMRSRVVKN
jgi:hypothetical protein